MAKKYDDEIFSFMTARFDIELAKRVIRTTPPKMIEIPLKDLANAFNFKNIECSLIRVDLNRVADLNEEALEETGIAVEMLGGTLLIDGWHRSYARWKKGYKTMKVYCFTDKKVIKSFSNLNNKQLDKG